MRLKNLKAIVTGGANGMGAYFAHQLIEAGAQVAAGDVSEEGLDKLPEGVHRRRLDVTRSADCKDFVSWANEAMGGLNGLVNNAGIIRDGLLVRKDRNTGEVRTMSDEQWQSVIDVNLTGATYMAREFAALIAEQDAPVPSAIINMSSVARHGNRGQSNYVAAKAALAANTVTWAREFARFGIRVGAIAPGMIEPPMTAGMKQKARDALVDMVPVGRIGVPEDIWLAVRFIFECDYFTARCLDVDGGLVM